MKQNADTILRGGRWLVFAFLPALAAGCSKAPPPSFHLNLVELSRISDPVKTPEEEKKEKAEEEKMTPDELAKKTAAEQEREADRKKTREQVKEKETDLASALEAMFGTPDNPVAMPQTGLDLRKLQMAAGPAGGQKRNGRVQGLYREHCEHCHGISGDGAGPTAAFLNPYPRDYRLGVFKFKSTEKAAKPTDADLKRVLTDGIPGTAMPSFKLLPNEQLDSLVEYVKYLAMRGEVEIQLIGKFSELGKDPMPLDRKFLVTGDDDYPGGLDKVTGEWKRAPQRVVKVVPRPTTPEFELAASVKRGRELFFDKAVDCKKCHGPLGLGDGGDVGFDDWSLKFTANDLALGALPRRAAVPRNLRSGVYRGGRRPIDIYYRIAAGIAGTPMPSHLGGAIKADKAADIWHLVDYILSLPYETDSDLTTPREREAAELKRL